MRRFEYRNISFQYTLILEDRKTISASVFPSKAVVVKAPKEAEDERIDDFLQRKFRWILKQRRFFEQFGTIREMRCVSGETVLYRGRCYKLLLRKAEGGGNVSLQHGTLTVSLSFPSDHERAKRLLDAWYMEKANRVFSERLSECFLQFGGKEMPALVIRKLNKRWGSYLHKSNTVFLNPELIKAATRHIDYVIIHELCHMIHRRHDRDFYELLGSKLPQWQKLKAELELNLLGGAAVYSI